MEPPSFEPLALPLLDDLHHAARMLTRDPSDADDLVQETYLRAQKYFGQYRPGTNFRAWIFTILRNAHIDQCRRRKTQPLSFEDASALAAAAPPSPHLPEEFSARLRSALDALSPQHRLLVFLCDVGEFSYREIAEILDCPIGTVMSGLFNARRRLRALMQD